MKQIRKFWREVLRPWWNDYEWPVIGGLTAAVVVLGYIGFRRQLRDVGLPLEQVDLLFRTAQLFVLQISMDPPMPWQLNVARVLAPLVAGYAALQALSQLLADQFQSISLHFLHRHVVVCGLGRKGLILARAFLARGQAVVVIEKDAENDLIAQCRDLGGVVLLGDATEPLMLRKARVARAANLFALCGDDGTNAEIAVRAERLVKPRSGQPLGCVLHITDAQLCTLLRERELDAASAGRMRLEFFNIFDLGTRAMLEKHPLWSPGADPATTSKRLVIVGVGLLGESLLVNSARLWHASGTLPGAKLKVTLIDYNAGEIAGRLQVRYPGLRQTCEIEPLDMDVRSAEFQQADFLAIRSPTDRPARVFVCLDDDSLSLSAALALGARGRDHSATIVVRMAQNAGLAVLLHAVDSIGGGFHHLDAFGLLDSTCTPDQILRGTHEILSRAIHDDYLREQFKAGLKPGELPALLPWSSLPDHFKDSNRQQADGIGAKLKAVACSTAPMVDWCEPLFEFTDDEVDRIARMEHDRWMREKTAAGWTPGPRNDSAKTHPSLIPYDDLPQAEKDKDIATALQLSTLLARVGFRIHRLPAKANP